MYNEEMFSLNIMPEVKKPDLFIEAVFKNGKEKIKSIEDSFAAIAAVYKTMEPELKRNEPKEAKEFYVHDVWKELEKNIIEVFGIRSVIFEPMTIRSTRHRGKYYLNCYTCTNMYHRFPIDGLLTDEGFYDKSRTLTTYISISQEMFKMCTPAEITAIFLHELGHNIDPNLVDIKYTGSSILIDNLLGKKISEAEVNKIKNKFGITGVDIMFIVLCSLLYLLPIVLVTVGNIIKKFESKEKKIERIKKLLKNAKYFNKHENSEAYADNIARMYGYGPDLVTALRKIDATNEEINLYSLKGKKDRRDKAILDIYESALKDVHGTDTQRIVALIKEYEEDLKDPSIPDGTKKWIKSDKEQLEEILDKYINDKDGIKANINKMIVDAMNSIDEVDQKSITESSDDILDLELLEEGKKHHTEYFPLNSDERKMAEEIFDKDTLIFIAKDKNGYLAKTHRARTKSYPTLQSLPISKVNFIKSTS